MAGFRCMMLSVALVLIATQLGRCQAPAATAPAGHTSKIYSLAEFGQDPQLCQWITQTIPTTIRPESWSTSEQPASAKIGNQGTLSYYAPGKVLVVYQTPAVHAQIDEFLQGLKKALPRESVSAPRAAQIVPAQYVPANAPPPPMPAPLGFGAGYPVPAATPVPKHLFHFIIRYEGEGIIDSNVVKFAKAMSGGASNSASVGPMDMTPLLKAMIGGSTGAPVMPSADNPPAAPTTSWVPTYPTNSAPTAPTTSAPTAPANAPLPSFPPPPPPPPFGPR